MTNIAGEVRFSFTRAPGMRFIRRPISVLPDQEVTGWVNNARRLTPAIFRDGEWRDLKRQVITWGPTHWTVPDTGSTK